LVPIDDRTARTPLQPGLALMPGGIAKAWNMKNMKSGKA
jgi:hypothetical protein